MIAFLPISLAAQTPLQYTRLTAEDGLSNNSVQCILQDKSGITWIGTNGGLNRYDGTSFIQYNVLSRPALTNSTVTALMQEADGSIWIGTENGLNILHPATNTIKQFIHNDASPASIPSGPIRVVQKLKNGDVLLMSDKWMATCNNRFSFSPVSIDSSLLQTNMVLTGFAEHGINEAWVSYLDQVTSLATLKGTNGRTAISNTVLQTADYAKMYVDTNQAIWSISCHGVNRFNSTTRRFENWLKNNYAPPFPNLHVHFSYCIDGDGNIWLASERADFVKYDLQLKQVTDYSWLARAANAKIIYCIYKDNNNNIWVGTDNGIIKISNRTSVFRNISFALRGKELKDMRSRRIITDKNGVLYAATENYGLLKLKPLASGGDTTIALSTFGATDIGKLPLIENAIHVPLNGKYDIGYMYDMWYDGGDFIWMAGFGISRFNTKADSLLIFLSGNSAAERQESISQFAICFDGKLFWTAGQSNIYTFDPQTLVMQPFTDAAGNMPFHNIICWSLALQGDWLWAGTYSGLYKINRITRHVIKVSIDPALESGINDIYIDADSSLWISTAGGGILHYNERTKEIRQYTNLDGLSNNTVCGMLGDNNNNLWISTYAGLSYFDRSARQFINFYAKDGLSSNEFNRKAFSRLPDGRMVFGGQAGYIVFNPEDAFKRDKPVSIILTGFSKITGANEVVEKVFGVDSLKEVVINPGDKFFSFNFTLTDMYDPAGNRYYYQLKGLEDSWHAIGSQNNISFNGLPAGNYTLIVKGNLGKGSASINELSVNILVKQVFYKTAWFILLMLAVAAGIIYAIVRYRIQQVKKIQLLRTRIASDLHDEVGSSLVHITMLADSLKRDGIKQNVQDNLAAIAGFSRGAVSTMKDVIWSIDARNDTMAGMIDHMHDHIHNVLAPANIEFQFTQEGFAETTKLPIDFRQNVYLIFKEAINNIVKHAGATQVAITLQKENGEFVMTIKDNGKGIGQMNRGSGQGISNMRMRAERLKGTLDITSLNSTEIVLKAPI